MTYSNSPTKFGIWLACLTIYLLTGCVSSRKITGVKPVHPPLPLKGTAGILIKEVDSITPSFEWSEYEKQENVSYDFAIWEIGYDTNEVPNGFTYGEPVYYEEKINNLSHTLNSPLEYNTLYMWSVRPRLEEEVGIWASYSENTISIWGSSGRSNWRFPFRTPNKEKTNDP